MIRSVQWLVILVHLGAVVAPAEPLRRRLPPECARHVPPLEASRDAHQAERSWNALYRSGHESIEDGDLDRGQASICAALGHAAGFGPRDWRFAETLDELGLIHFLRGDFEASIAAQAGAVAEMLLAEGPRAPGARAGACASVTSYAARLAYPLERSGRKAEAQRIQGAPYRVFTLGLVRVDRPLADRLGWLVSEYLALEDMEAARALQEVADRVLAGGPDTE